MSIISVNINHTVVSKKIEKELSLGRIAGPYAYPPLDQFVVSPLGVVPKKAPNEFRLIHDLSFPKSNSVNSHIDLLFTSVSYETLDHCVKLILELGPRTLIAKADLKDAFRIIPIHPDDYRLLGFMWKDAFYYDKCLPMGCSISCQIFESLSTSIQWILTCKLSVPHMSHILDDFIFFGPPSSPICKRSLDTFMVLAQSLKLPVKEEKTVLPSTKVELHGITVDTITMELTLPPDKLSRALTQIRSMVS